jgi:ubiquinone/menaquinone biosynthesis C-methylase UbiE
MVRLFPNRLIIIAIRPEKLIEFDEIVRMADLNPDDIVLDIGCGSGQQALLLGRKCKRVVGIDLSDGGIKKAKNMARISGLSERVSYLQGNVLEADFPNGSFNKIVSFCVLEHIPEWQEVLKKAHQWLAPGGSLVISVDSLAPIKDEALINKHKEKYSVAIYFDTQTLGSSLRDAGFSRFDIHPILRSAQAKKNFIEEITTNRSDSLNLLQWISEYNRLREAENETDSKDEGIFLVARAYL